MGLQILHILMTIEWLFGFWTANHFWDGYNLVDFSTHEWSSSDDYLDEDDDYLEDDDDDDDADEAFEAKDGSSNGGVTVWFGGFNFFSTARPQSRPLFLTIGVEREKVEVFLEQISTYCSSKKLKFGGFNFFLALADSLATFSHHRCYIWREKN